MHTLQVHPHLANPRLFYLPREATKGFISCSRAITTDFTVYSECSGARFLASHMGHLQTIRHSMHLTWMWKTTDLMPTTVCTTLCSTQKPYACVSVRFLLHLFSITGKRRQNHRRWKPYQCGEIPFHAKSACVYRPV